jgi:hypothetical protein
MASTEMRRLILDPQLDPQIARIGIVVNRLVDMANGNGAGRIWLLHDDGNKKATSGSAAVPPGTVLSANNYPLRVEPTSTNQVNVLHSNGATIGLRVQDAGLTSGVPASLTSTLTVTGATILQSTLAVTGATTLSSTLAVTGATNLNGAVTLGDNAADVITVTGTATFAEIVTMAKGLVVDTTTLVVDAVNNKVGVGAVPVSTDAMFQAAGTMRSTAINNPTTGTGMEMAYSAGTGYLVSVDRATTTFKLLEIYGSSIKLMGGAANKLEADATGVGFNGQSPVAAPSLSGSAAAVYDATTRQLINDIRDCLQDNGLAT